LCKISDIVEVIKLPVKYIIAIFLILFSLLFFPEVFITKLGLSQIVQKYRAYIGLAFLVSSFFIIVHISTYLIKYLKALYEYSRLVRHGIKRLKELTPKEKHILNEYIINNTRTSTLAYNSGVVRELESYKIIYRSSNVSTSHLSFSYNINPWAWKYLNKNKHLLE